MKKLVLCIVTMTTACLISCAESNKAHNTGNESDSAAVENKEKMMADSANVGAGSLAEMEQDNEPTEGAPIEGEEWDVSVRTIDLDSDPRYEVIIRNSEGKTMTVGERKGFDYPTDMLETFGNVWQTDVDFDGHTDVLIFLGNMPASDQTFVQYDAWLYNPDDGKFYCPDTFREILNPEVDREETRILSHYIARDGKTRVYSAHYWQKDGNIQQVGETWTVSPNN